MKVVIIGAGAAGCFCAVQLKRMAPSVSVTVLEAQPKALAKVAITGGGRCNLTNSFAGIRSLPEAYPRGGRILERAFQQFNQKDTWEWFEKEGVPLILQADHCVFPRSQDAMDIVRTLLHGMRAEGVGLRTHAPVRQIEPTEGGYRIDGGDWACEADQVVVTTGGCRRKGGPEFLAHFDLKHIDPVPSLFTLTVRDAALRAHMGTVIPAALSIPGTRFRAEGPLLITDWGLSGPATLKLSSYAARYLAENQYRVPLSIQWLPGMNEMEIRASVRALTESSPQRLLSSVHPEGLSARLWKFLLERSGLREDLRCGELGAKGLNRLVATLSADPYPVEGKSRFREEFVICGGIAAENVNPSTLEAKKYPGLYFAGEVLDIDAITGGFNLQAAWSTGYAVAKALSEKEIRQL